MGSNNSTCLPCKVTGGSARRTKAVAGSIDPKDGESQQTRILKKVSTAADPHGGGRAAAAASTSKGSPTNGATYICGQPLQGHTELDQQQPSYSFQEEPLVLPRPTGNNEAQQEGDAQVALEEREDSAEGMASFSHSDPSRNGFEVEGGNTKSQLPCAEQPVQVQILQHQQHIHVPSHMLATEAEPSWQHHQDSQKALLSPHSCSVAHRVAAALRAAAGERAAAAAARAAEAVKAAKASSKEIAERQAAVRSQHHLASSGSVPYRGLRSAASTKRENSTGQICHGEKQQLHSPSISCLPQVPCFTASEESKNEVTIKQCPDTEPMSGSSDPADFFVVAAAKRVGNLLSTAATAAASMASGGGGGDQPADGAATSTKHEDQAGCNPRDRQEGLVMVKGCELEHSAAVLLGAVDRAMDTINSDGFKKQAVTLLSQSISVAASVVEVVKKCGETSPSHGIFPQENLDKDPGENGCAPDLTGYYEALRMSAQQQLSEMAAHEQLTA
ncbi:hypothetical protein Efla_006765 [Eimeria flavescens]